MIHDARWRIISVISSILILCGRADALTANLWWHDGNRGIWADLRLDLPPQAFDFDQPDALNYGDTNSAAGGHCLNNNGRIDRNARTADGHSYSYSAQARWSCGFDPVVLQGSQGQVEYLTADEAIESYKRLIVAWSPPGGGATYSETARGDCTVPVMGSGVGFPRGSNLAKGRFLVMQANRTLSGDEFSYSMVAIIFPIPMNLGAVDESSFRRRWLAIRLDAWAWISYNPTVPDSKLQALDLLGTGSVSSYAYAASLGWLMSGTAVSTRLVSIAENPPFEILSPWSRPDETASPFVVNGHLTSDRVILSRLGTPVRGAAADGATLALVRMRLPVRMHNKVVSSNKVVFSVTNRDLSNGSLAAIGSSQFGQIVEATAEGPPDNRVALCWYRAPKDFVVTQSDQNAIDRMTIIDAEYSPEYTPSNAGGTWEVNRIPLVISRPPVLLVHGLWSSRAAWDGFPLLEENAWKDVFTRADYENLNDNHVARIVLEYPNWVNKALQKQFDRGIAATRVDVIAHSMGGILSRLHVQSAAPRAANYGQGDVNRLITLNTPHLGSPWAATLKSTQSSAIFLELLRYAGHSIDRGAIDDLVPGSSALSQLGASSIPCFALVGSASLSASGQGVAAFPLSWTLSNIVGSADPLLGARHDYIVPSPSQAGGIGVDAQQEFSHAGSFHTFATTDATYSQSLKNVLNGSVSRGFMIGGQQLRFGSFPAGLSRQTSAYLADRTGSAVVPQSTATGTIAAEPSLALPVGLVLQVSSSAVVPGGKIDLSVTSQNGVVLRSVFVAGADLITALARPNWIGNMTLPANRAGTIRLRAFAESTSGSVMMSDEVAIRLQPTSSLTSLDAEPKEIRLNRVGESEHITIKGVFADKSVLTYDDPITTYRSSNESIATIDSRGFVFGVAAGDATITITNGSLQTRTAVNVSPLIAGRIIGPEGSVYYGATALNESWGLYLRPDGSGVFIALGGTAATTFMANVTVKADGTFGSASLSVSGRINGTQITGQMGSNNQTFTGNLDTASGKPATAAYYKADGLNGAAGTTHVVTGPSGRILAMTITPTGVDSLTGVVNANGILSGTSTAGAQSVVTLENSNQSVWVQSTTTGANPVLTSYGGLTEGVSNTTRLANLSVRAASGSGSQVLGMGFVISGSGTKPVMIRGIGPALAPFGVTGYLANPQLTVFDSSSKPIATNAGWGGSTTLANAFTQVGAFPLNDPKSADAVLQLNLSAGTYTAQCSGNGNTTGVALVEAYDMGTTGTSRLTNVSVRTQVGTGGNILITGFFNPGNGPKQMLIRAIGPSLAQFGVTGVLAKPKLELHTLVNQKDAVISSNAGWGGTQVLADAFSKVGAFALPANSADAALLVLLHPGLVTVQVSGADGGTGVALAEIYELP